MAPDPSDGVHAPGPVSAEVRGEIMQELVESVSSAVNTQFDSFTSRLADALLRATTSTSDPAEAKRYSDSAALLKKNRYPFYYAACERLVATLEREIQLAEDPSSASTIPSAAKKALPADMEVDRKLTMLKVSRAIEEEHRERLSVLNLRLGYLYGVEELEMARNPFRPQIFLDVIHDTWCALHPDPNSHHLAFRLLKPSLSLDMAAILHAANSTLVRRGILPRLAEPSQVVPLTMDITPAAQGKASADPANTVAQQLRQMFPESQKPAPVKSGTRSSLNDAFPALFAQDVLNAAAGRNELLNYLAKVRKHTSHASLLEQIRQQAPQGLLTPEDEQAFELLGKVFAAVFRDTNLPAEIRELIGSLQVPVLEAALTNKNFFFSESHPARRVIALLANLGVDWDRNKEADDPLYQTILRNVKRIQSDQRLGAFTEALADIEAFLSKEERASHVVLSEPIAKALKKDKRLQAAKAARHDVAQRIDTGEVIAFVEDFLEDKWVSVLTLAYSVKDSKPQAVTSAVRTMDELVWSVKPKFTMEEREDLLGRLPPLLAMLNKWLDLIKWDDEGRTQFFAELAECHASIVRAPLDLTPKRQVELALEAAQQAAERRQQRLSKVEPEPVTDMFTERVQKLECGSWITFTPKKGTPLKVKLAWISPSRSYFVFSTRGKQEALSLSAEALAKALREQRAHILSTSGLVERALAEALGLDDAGHDMLTHRPAA
ncbi:DUF1631 domain-containing protein [Noviherbaspirillum agri]